MELLICLLCAEFVIIYKSDVGDLSSPICGESSTITRWGSLQTGYDVGHFRVGEARVHKHAYS